MTPGEEAYSLVFRLLFSLFQEPFDVFRIAVTYRPPDFHAWNLLLLSERLYVAVGQPYDLRELLDFIEAKGREVAEALAALRGVSLG